MDVMDDMYKFIGCEIKFFIADSEYEGIVKFITPALRRITIEKVVLLPNMKRLGIQHFFSHEFRSYFLINKPQPNDNGNIAPLSSNFQYSYQNRSNKGNGVLDHDETASECGTEYEDLDDFQEEEFTLLISDRYKNQLPKDSSIIDCINSNFFDAICSIEKEESIGLSFEGTAIGRKGCLEWLCVSTKLCTFLFDIKTLGGKAFSEGMKRILENPDIEKVIHDCRQASDCLYHQFHTSLVNVFDTQVADLFVTMQLSKIKKKSVIKHVFPVDNCLVRHLNLDPSYLCNEAWKKKFAEEDSVMLASRPLSNKCRSKIISNVLYLKLLKAKLVELMMNPFHRAVEIYLKVLKDASEQELKLEPSVPQFVPLAVLMDGIQTVCFDRFMDVSSTPSSGFAVDTARNPIDQILKCVEIPFKKRKSPKKPHFSNKAQQSNGLDCDKTSCSKNDNVSKSDKRGISPELTDGVYSVKFQQHPISSCRNNKIVNNDLVGESENGLDEDKFFHESLPSQTNDECPISGCRNRVVNNDIFSEGENERDEDNVSFSESISSQTSDENDVSSKIPHIEWSVYDDREMPKNVILVPAGMLDFSREHRKKHSCTDFCD